MKRIITAFLLVTLACGFGGQQSAITRRVGLRTSGTNCAAPAGTTYQWTASNTTCVGSCVSGASVSTVSEPIAGNTLTEFHSGTSQATQWYPNQINGKPAWDFNGDTCPACRDALTMSTAIPNSGSWTIFFIANRLSAAGTDRDYIGNNGFAGALQLVVNSSNQYSIHRQAQAVITTGGTNPANTWVAFGVEWNFSTGSGDIFTCPGGGASCNTIVASGSSGMSASTNQIGRTSDDPPKLIAEVAAINSISGTNLANIGTYVKCQYNF